MTEKSPLYTKPPYHAFKANQMGQLEVLLTQSERATTLFPLADTQDLLLAEDGRTRRGNYRYTSHAFKQLTQLLCPGLSKMLPDLAGTIKRADLPDHLYFRPVAQRIFNQVLDLRFQVLSQYRVIRDEHARLIEGFVGVKHRPLENLDSFRQMRDAIESMAPEAKFFAAVLSGRRLTLWFRNECPSFQIQVGSKTCPIRVGYYFSNGEATGSSVRGAFALYTNHGACLRPFKKNERVTHIGRDFSRRLHKMFRAVLSDELQPGALQALCQASLPTPLGYAGLDNKAVKERDQRLVRGLGELGIPQRIGAGVLNDAVLMGADSEPMQPYQLSLGIGSRTIFDLFVALLRTARKLPINQREKVEQAAYLTLTGKLQL